MLREFDLGWLSGILEGEGCFWILKKKNRGRLYRYPKISVVMTDEDTIKRVADLLGGMAVTPQRGRSGRQTTFRTGISGERALDLMEEVYPFMSKRRRDKIAEMFVEFRPGAVTSIVHP